MSRTAWLLALTIGCGGERGSVDESDPTDDAVRDQALARCETPAYPPRQLRLLTRAAYDATVADLLPFLGTTCARDSDCDLQSQSCVDERCRADACETFTFLLPAPDGPYRSAHVAGTFNDWAPTVAQGGWPMTWVAEQQVYVAKRAVPDGEHQYKLVVDDGARWLPDPSNPATTPDGFGGQNSVLIQACAGAAPPAPVTIQPSAGFPPESRPPGFAFDNHADAGLVTAVHVEAALEAASTLASQALQRSDAWLPCDPADRACVRTTFRDLAERAYRTAVTDDQLDRLMAAYDAQDDGRAGVSAALQAVLVSPHFLYRSELGREQPDGTFLLTPDEIATALAYTLWGTMPDDALREAAARGALDTPAGIEAQARRMLDDPRAHDVVGRFAAQWLALDKVLSVDKNAQRYPGFTEAVRAAMLAEAEAFVDHVVFEGDGRLATLLTADFTFVNDVLADWYDLPRPGSAAPTRVALPEGRRAGLLGQGAMAVATSHSDQTSPIRRGVLVRRRILCQDLPDPPPDAGGVPEVDPDATTRERFAQHTAVQACANCHVYIDDPGFAFEHLDPVGRWRTADPGGDIDASGTLVSPETLGDGTELPFDGVEELAALLADTTAGEQCFTDQWLGYAIGRVPEADDCSRRRMMDAFTAADGDVKTLLVALVTSPSFVRRRAP